MKWENGSDPRKRNQSDALQALWKLWTLGTRVTGLFLATIIAAQTSYTKPGIGRTKVFAGTQLLLCATGFFPD
ncbi:hypothetical protein ACFX59_02310 [Sphingomonas sp. NCPPB 2930]|uniref:hypothetical protein n=1 Tax=Sphingomonas sp. NCPPB 2930 TaxID=3162788 RepID=UPI0036DBD6BE